MPSRNLIVDTNSRPSFFTEYSFWRFSDWRALEAAAKLAIEKKPSAKVNRANSKYAAFVNRQINNGLTNHYGLFGKHPKSYQEAFERETFLYYDEYKKIKEKVEQKIKDELQKSSSVEVMKPKLVFNDKQIGEFVFERAAMALQPNIYFYSPSQNREIDSYKEKIVYKGKEMFLQSDDSKVVYAVKVELEDGTYEYVELKEGEEAEESLKKASEKGVIDCSSANKKVYLYKEKKPKVFNAVKIIVGMTKGGWTSWANDFYTGITAACCVDILETLGYSVAVEVVMGGGRCNSSVCGTQFPLNFKKTYFGRRYFTFTAKSFDSLADMDGLLYTLCDPSFHNIKFMSYLNNFLNWYGDGIDDSDEPDKRWHGIEREDMMNPIGMYYKRLDAKKGNDNVLHFYIHKVADEDGVVAQIKDIAEDCENLNREALIKFQSHDYGID